MVNLVKKATQAETIETVRQAVSALIPALKRGKRTDPMHDELSYSSSS
jgi:hypothetical protein